MNLRFRARALQGGVVPYPLLHFALPSSKGTDGRISLPNQMQSRPKPEYQVSDGLAQFIYLKFDSGAFQKPLRD